MRSTTEDHSGISELSFLIEFFPQDVKVFEVGTSVSCSVLYSSHFYHSAYKYF